MGDRGRVGDRGRWRMERGWVTGEVGDRKGWVMGEMGDGGRWVIGEGG